MKKSLFFVCLFIICLPYLYAHEVTVTDLYGRKVLTPAEITKTAAIGPGALRILVYANVQSTVVGRELFESKLDRNLRPYTYSLGKSYYKLPVISKGGPGKMPDIEQLILADPDVIFATAFSATDLDFIARKTDIPVVGLTYGATGHTDIEKFLESIRLVGYITHNQKQTQSLLNKIAMLRKDLMNRTEGVSPKSVFMSSVAYKGSRGFQNTERNHPSLKLIRAENIADTSNAIVKSGTHVTMQTETILKRQPQFIFYDISGFKDLQINYKKLYSTLSLLRAVKEGAVYSVMPYNWYNSNVENIFLTAYFIGKIIYPERFTDVDIAHIADDIYNAFFGISHFTEITAENMAYRRMIFEKSGFKTRTGP